MQSSHGFSAGEDAYLMPRDGLIEFLSATAVALDDVEGAARLGRRPATSCCWWTPARTG